MAIPDWPTYSDDSGSGEDGTDLEKSFFDAIHNAVDAIIRGEINTSTTANNIIDEVVAARGSESVLDDRLDASLGEDGLIADVVANYASDTHVGLVSVGAQNIAGAKKFFTQPTMRHGSDTASNATASARRVTSLGTLGNVGSSETTLHSETLAANAMDANGKLLRLTAWGRFAANANTKTYRVKVGGITVLEFASAGNDRYWRAVVEIVRVTSASANVSARFEHGPTTDSPIDDNRLMNSLSIAITWTGAVTVQSTGQSSAVSSNDLLEDMWVLEAIG